MASTDSSGLRKDLDSSAVCSIILGVAYLLSYSTLEKYWLDFFSIDDHFTNFHVFYQEYLW